MSNQTLRPIAPTPLQIHQQNYYAARDPSYIPFGGPFTPDLANDSFLADPCPVHVSADISRPLQASSSSLFDQGVGSSFESTQRHDLISGPDLLGYQPWTGALAVEPLQDRPCLIRSNTLTSVDPVPGAIASQLPSGVFPPMALSSHAPASQSSSSTDDDAPLTSTQIAAFGGQALPPDHPLYSEVTAQIHGPGLETASRSKSVSVNSKPDASVFNRIIELRQAILLTLKQNKIREDTVLRDSYSVRLST